MKKTRSPIATTMTCRRNPPQSKNGPLCGCWWGSSSLAIAASKLLGVEGRHCRELPTVAASRVKPLKRLNRLFDGLFCEIGFNVLDSGENIAQDPSGRHELLVHPHCPSLITFDALNMSLHVIQRASC